MNYDPDQEMVLNQNPAFELNELRARHDRPREDVWDVKALACEELSDDSAVPSSCSSDPTKPSSAEKRGRQITVKELLSAIISEGEYTVSDDEVVSDKPGPSQRPKKLRFTSFKKNIRKGKSSTDNLEERNLKDKRGTSKKVKSHEGDTEFMDLDSDSSDIDVQSSRTVNIFKRNALKGKQLKSHSATESFEEEIDSPDGPGPFKRRKVMVKALRKMDTVIGQRTDKNDSNNMGEADSTDKAKTKQKEQSNTSANLMSAYDDDSDVSFEEV
ncbi:hypothetical protein AAG570_007801 [Ranatra chinensis]|uniref:Uncharacterized protein n=1 Tax=Ranatra chinensis TaxID=642074 RepID=A0ABD0Y7T3_9HEMI